MSLILYKFCCRFSPVFQCLDDDEGTQGERRQGKVKETVRESKNISVCNFCVCLIVSQSFFSSFHFVFGKRTAKDSFSGTKTASRVHVWHFSHFTSAFFYFYQKVIGFRKFLLFSSTNLSKISCSNFSSRDEEKKRINNCIFSVISGSVTASSQSIFVCALRLPYLISNMKQAREARRRNNRINFNDQWAFCISFFFKKKVTLHTRIQETN